MSQTRCLYVLASLALASGALAASRNVPKEAARPLPVRPTEFPSIESVVLSELPRLRTQLEAWLDSLGALERGFGERVGQVAAGTLSAPNTASRTHSPVLAR